MKKNKKLSLSFGIIVAILVMSLVLFKVGMSIFSGVDDKGTKDKYIENTQKQSNAKTTGEAVIMASGDMLYHDNLYWSAETEKGYDFANNYEMIKDLISSADLALGDFEGTISKDRPLAGYPLFNAPVEVVKAIKDAGYDVIDLAHNHILDSQLTGAIETKSYFENAGLDTLGIKNKSDDKILVKEINGIKIAILGFSYGYNGMEANLSDNEYNTHMQDLNPNKVEKTLKEAEKIADITIVMPQIGVEYSLDPTEEQKNLYRNMVDWGADIIFGGHPHVPEPTEIIKKDGKKKFILYSMGNLISNQRYETLENYWTERGVIMEVGVKQKSDKKGDVILTYVKPHPTWVLREANGKTHKGDGYPLHNYQTLLCEDYIKGGKNYGKLDQNLTERIEIAYKEVIQLMNVDKELCK